MNDQIRIPVSEHQKIENEISEEEKAFDYEDYNDQDLSPAQNVRVGGVFPR